MKNPITVLLADDHTILREGLRALLKSDPGIEVVGEAEDGREAVRKTDELRPDVLIMDISMPNLNGLEAARQIVKGGSSTRILILSAHSDEAYVNKAMETGASGYLVKHTVAHVLPEAIRDVFAGRGHFPPSVKARFNRQGGIPDDRTHSLTSRETEVWQLVAEGQPNKMIADKLSISIKTVEKHRQNLMDKLAIHDTAGLTRHAIACGIIESGVEMRILRENPPGA